MRSLAFAALLAACGAAQTPAPRAPPAAAIPAQDLAGAKLAVPAPHDAGLAPRDPRVVDLDIIRIVARTRGPGGEPELVASASADLFKEANEAAKSGRPREAVARYRQLLREFPDSQFAPVSLFNVAAVHDAQGDYAATVAALTELVAQYPASRESIDGHLYMAALQADHADWDDALATLDAVLARGALTFADRVEAFARRGYVELERRELDKAEAAIAQAIAAWRSAPRIDDPYYVAMAHYYRGELLHRRFLASPVRSGDDEMVADLEIKRGLAARAYDAWRDSLGFRHAYWATAAGYQMSQIFVELWEAHVTAPYPKRVAQSARQSYVVEVHARVRDDLAKALEGHQMNIELAKAYGVETPWSRGSAQQAAAITELLAKDRAGHYRTPASGPGIEPKPDK